MRGITVGIIGAGEVGRRVLALLSHFQVRLLLADPFVSADQAAALGAEKRELEALFAESDVVSVHAPNNDQTRHMVNAERLALLRDGAILINTSRGPLVDQEALVAELHRRRIWAFIDVTDPEPPPPEFAAVRLPAPDPVAARGRVDRGLGPLPVALGARRGDAAVRRRAAAQPADPGDGGHEQLAR